MNPFAVALVIDGAFAPSVPPARLVLGRVMIPLPAIVARVADRAAQSGDAIVLVRGERACTLRVGAATYVCSGVTRDVTAIPFTASGTAFVALSDVARAFGGTAEYDGRTRTASLTLPPDVILRTPEPFDPLAPQASPTQVFTPSPPPATPRPADTGIPRPRRTAIPVTPSRFPD
jgi:hypothetical protein